MAVKVSRPRGRRLVALVAVLAVLLGGGSWAAVAASDGSAGSVQRQDQVLALPEKPGSKATVRIDTSYFTSTAVDGRRPAVLLGHGFGASKAAAKDQAQQLARAGYAVLTWSARGFGRSTGKIGLNDPEGEVADVSGLIDWLAKRPDVQLDKPGDPRVGMTGASYGGAIALLTAGHDRRVDAIAPQITYWNLADALFPDGVFKKLWAGYFFTTGSAPVTTSVPNPARGVACHRFEAQLCRMYERVAVSGRPDDEARKMLERRSPQAVADRIKVPTLITQGQSDSLFPLGQADAIAKALKKNGAPVAVDWIEGGHDGGAREEARVLARTEAWFARYLKGERGTDTGPAFRISRSGGLDARDGASRLRGASGDSYPGLRGDPRSVPLAGREQTLANPAGGDPPAISSVPGIGAALGGLSALGNGPSLDFPGQYARFESRALKSPVQVTGSPTAKLRVTSDSGEAVLFAKVYDVGPDGRSQLLPHQLVTPLRVTDAKDGRTVSVRLPAIDHEFAAGHRMRLVVAATDMAYASPAEPAVYKVALAGKNALSVPTAPGVHTAATPLPWWVWGLPLAAVLIAAALLLTGRRRTTPPAPDPDLADVPLRITGLTKKYHGAVDRYAVQELTFGVDRGQVLGLLGPNGAGKTTTLRMLMGLITPDEGEIRVFGHAVRPGAPVLSRVGAFVEGAGFLPHLTGRENLDLYWRATGRPAEDAHIDEALEIAGLGEALQRAVRTYSQGMRQRLAIAQAMLGLPDLLILDEPTNGLDPPQIREMRDVMTRYAAEGRTVIVSSHLLAEVEQTCTHLVVMDRGRLVQAGPVAEIVGTGDTLLVGTSAPVPDGVVEKVAALPFVTSAVRADDGLLVRLDGTAGTHRLLAELLRLEVPVDRVGPHRRLEDAFLTLIGGDR
ncbi:CocE/NonD family hydrolase [Streptomyces violens]|uniref:CocE/NonD family hydrolase n=1 Tax=Streptomyces violens TaxID=66377 RepID=UPI0004C24E28|nr:CocE/NonD family hydrolase [Streptomyces violens]